MDLIEAITLGAFWPVALLIAILILRPEIRLFFRRTERVSALGVTVELAKDYLAQSDDVDQSDDILAFNQLRITTSDYSLEKFLMDWNELLQSIQSVLDREGWDRRTKSKYTIFTGHELDFLIERGYLSEADANMLRALRKSRNAIVHSLEASLVQDDLVPLGAAIRVLKKRLVGLA